MIELAVEYRAEGLRLKERIQELNVQLRQPGLREMDKFRLRGRIDTLAAMYREVNEAAYTMEHYYDRRYRRNGRYTI